MPNDKATVMYQFYPVCDCYVLFEPATFVRSGWRRMLARSIPHGVGIKCVSEHWLAEWMNGHSVLLSSTARPTT